MTAFKTDDGGNLLIEGNTLVLADPKQEIKQRLQQELKFFSQEWFLDITKGIPYVRPAVGETQKILGVNVNRETVEAIFKRAILLVPGVKTITRFSLEENSQERTLDVTFSADTDEGELNVEETLP